MNSIQDSQRPLRIGVSACVFHADSQRTTFNGRPLLYVEQSMSDWLMTAGALPFMIPFASGKRPTSVGLREFVGQMDGLLIQGGVDMSPKSYGEEALRPEWSGDHVRDQYEMELIRHCLDMELPVLGICRGHQVLNVALGGSLYQDIQTQVEGAFKHRCSELYEKNRHKIDVIPGSRLSKIYGGIKGATINSVHHQAIKKLGEGLIVEAVSSFDGIIEAVRLQPEESGNNGTYAVGVQWHPEFQDPMDEELLNTMPLLEDFLNAVRTRQLERQIC